MLRNEIKKSGNDLCYLQQDIKISNIPEKIYEYIINSII